MTSTSIPSVKIMQISVLPKRQKTGKDNDNPSENTSLIKGMGGLEVKSLQGVAKEDFEMQEEAKSPVKLTTKAVLDKKITLVKTVFQRSEDPKSNWKLFGEPMVAVFNAMKSLKCKRCGEEGHREERCQYMNLLREEAVKAGKLYLTAF